MAVTVRTSSGQHAVKISVLLAAIALGEASLQQGPFEFTSAAGDTEACQTRHSEETSDEVSMLQTWLKPKADGDKAAGLEASRLRSGDLRGTCSSGTRSCLLSHCCVEEGYSCFVKDGTQAKCRPTCPSRWDCTVLTTTTTTSTSVSLAVVDHLTAASYHEQLRRGIVVSWAEFRADIELYRTNGIRLPQLLQNATRDAVSPAENDFDHLRVRFSGGDTTYDELWSKLDPVVEDALSLDFNVVLAYKGWTDEAAWTRAGFIDTWRRVAEHYMAASDKLAFNLFIEISNIMCHHASACDLLTIMTDDALANALYVEAIRAIRASNPTRVIVLPGPGKLNRPNSLVDLDWTSLNAEGLCRVAGHQYCFTEWHVAAAGPCNPVTVADINPNYTCSDSRWAVAWTGASGTAAQRAHVESIVDYADRFTGTTGIKTWVGAFMPGPYRHAERGYYTYEEQAGFVNYYASLLHGRAIPYAVLSGSASQFGGPPCHRTVQARDYYSGAYVELPDGTVPPTCDGTEPVQWIDEMRGVRNAVLRTYPWGAAR